LELNVMLGSGRVAGQPRSGFPSRSKPKFASVAGLYRLGSKTFSAPTIFATITATPTAPMSR